MVYRHRHFASPVANLSSSSCQECSGQMFTDRNRTASVLRDYRFPPSNAQIIRKKVQRLCFHRRLGGFWAWDGMKWDEMGWNLLQMVGEWKKYGVTIIRNMTFGCPQLSDPAKAYATSKCLTFFSCRRCWRHEALGSLPVATASPHTAQLETFEDSSSSWLWTAMIR